MKKICALLLALTTVVMVNAATAGDVTNYTVGNVYYDYYPEGHDWWIELSIPGEDGHAIMVFNYDVVAPATGLVAEKVYHKSDFYKGNNSYNFMQDAEGTYRYSDADIMVKYDEVMNISYVKAHATLMDGRQYELTYVSPQIVAADTVDLNFPDGRYEDYTTESGQIRFRGWDESMRYNLYVTLLTSSIVGEYTWLDIDKPLTSLYRFTPATSEEEEGDLEMIPLLNGTINVAETEGGYMVEAYLLALDSHCYHATIFCPVPTVQEQVAITSSEMVLDPSFWETEGYYYFTAADDTYEVYLAIFPHDYEGIVGHYNEHDLELTYSLVYDYQKDEIHEIFASDLQVTRNEQLQYVITGTLLCFNGVEYTLNLRRVETLGYDTDEPFEATYVRGETTLIDQYLQEYGVLSLLSVKYDNSATFLEFHVDFEKDMREHYEATGEYLIPEGVYPIDESGRTGTVSASMGVTREPMPSYSVLIEGADVMTETLWFMVAGEVTVSRVSGVTYVEVEAQNSYCQRIHVLIEGVQMYEGVENISADTEGVQKVLRDGQLVIMRGGVEYGVLGDRHK